MSSHRIAAALLALTFGMFGCSAPVADEDPGSAEGAASADTAKAGLTFVNASYLKPRKSGD